MTVTNNNLRLIDRPIWEQLTTAPASTAAGVACVDDGVRYIYWLFTATSFWQYDTWADTWMQLPNPPGGTLAAGSCLLYVKEQGTQINGEVYGSVYALIASGAAVVFYRYDIGTSVWYSLSSTNIPAAWGTDGALVMPEPVLNGYTATAYHNALALNVITATSTAAISATTIAVSALPLALPVGSVLNFGTLAAPIWAVTTIAATAGVTSLTVSPLVASVPSAAVAYWYADMFLFGNAATVMYRYNINANFWFTTSANSGTPALPAVTAAPGAGLAVCWLPGSGDTNALDRIILLRGSASSAIYEYSLTGNTFSTVTYYPSTETFSTGSSNGIRTNAAGKSNKLVIQQNATGKILEFDRLRSRMDGKVTQNIIAQGAGVVGDKTAVMKSPEGIEFLFTAINTGSYYLRTPLFF